MEATIFLPIGMGLIVIGAGLGISRFAAAAAESITSTGSSVRNHCSREPSPFSFGRGGYHR